MTARALGALVCVVASLAALASLSALAGSPSEPAGAAMAAERRTPTYVAFGDSITAGLGTTDPEVDNYATLAGLDSRGLGGRCLVATKSPCVGRPLVEVFAGQVTRTGADVAVVLIGVNDVLASTDPRAIEAGYRRLVAIGRARGVRVVLGTLTPGAQGSDWRRKDPARQRLNAWIRERDHIDYAAALENERTYLRPELDLGDGLHPNDAGQARLAQTLTSWIERDRD